MDKFTSHVEWPAETGIGVSEDTHDTQAQADAVCSFLRRNGLGGEGKVFPLRTWTTPPSK